MSSKYTDTEFKQIHKLKHENKKLKKENASLRKQLSRIDVDRYHNLKELVQKQYNEDQKEFEEDNSKATKDKWECHKCHQDVLRIIIVSRIDGDFYFRRCSCGNRTKLQRYDDKVEGYKLEIK